MKNIYEKPLCLVFSLDSDDLIRTSISSVDEGAGNEFDIDSLIGN